MKLILSIKTEKIQNEKEKNKITKNQNNKCCFCEMKITNETSEFVLYNKKQVVCCNICLNALRMEDLNIKNIGKIALIPELSQADIINLSRAIFYFKKIKDKIKDDFDSVLLIEEDIKERAELANHFYSPGISDPTILVLLLSSIYHDEIELYAKREAALMGLRWIPDNQTFENEYILLEKEYNKFTSENWNSLIKTIIKTLNK